MVRHASDESLASYYMVLFQQKSLNNSTFLYNLGFSENFMSHHLRVSHQEHAPASSPQHSAYILPYMDLY